MSNARRHHVRALIASACVLALPAGAATTYAVATPSSSPEAVSIRTTSASVPDDRGSWGTRPTAAGTVITWTSPGPLPITDARPEFHVDGLVIGYPSVDRSGRILTLVVSNSSLGVDDVSAIEVWFSGRRLDLVGRPSVDEAGAKIADFPVGDTVTPAVDPGTAGVHPVKSFDYRSEPLPWHEFKSDMEVLGHAVLPTDVANAPLVLFLHGRHAPCYVPGKAAAGPCRGSRQPIPSYLGYDYLQRLLASQGYATVSISANVINNEDYKSPDGGSAARSALTRHHLRLLAKWTADTSNPRWHDTTDPSQVILVGHSRGGEGVNQAVIDAAGTAPYDIDGQVLIAPVDFSYQTAGYTPTVTFLPYCDGDVFDLQGQRFTDAAQTLTDDDTSLRSSILIRGANHNFFNTEWTPGISQAPSNDDWFDKNHRLCGQKVSPTRLSAREQRRVAKTFVAASVRAILEGEQGALDLIDSGRPVQLPDAGNAVAWTHAIGGSRTTVRLGDGAKATGTAIACRSGKRVQTFERVTRPLCGLPSDFARQLHWTTVGQGYFGGPEPAFARFGLSRHLSFEWAARDTVGGMALTSPLDGSSPRAVLDLRVVADPTSPGSQVAFRLSDGTDSWTSAPRAIKPFPGNASLSAVWARTVRLDLAAAGASLDLANLQSVKMVSRSDSGKVWLLDVSVRRPGAEPVADVTLPNIKMGAATVTEGDAGGTRTALVPYKVVGPVTERATFAVTYVPTTLGMASPDRYVKVTVEPGATGGTIAVVYRSDSTDDEDRTPQRLLAVPLTNIEMSDYHGRLTVTDDDPTPTLTLTPQRTPVRYGATMVYVAELSAPTSRLVALHLRGIVTDLPQLRTSALTQAFIEAHEGDVAGPTPADAVAARYIRSFLYFGPGDTVVRFAVATKANPLHPGRASLTFQVANRRLDRRDRATVWVR